MSPAPAAVLGYPLTQTLMDEVVDRAANDFERWESQVAHTGHCHHPIRLDHEMHKSPAFSMDDLAKLIEGYLELLADRDKLFALMRKELLEIKQQFATPRRTEILDNEFEQDIEDLIQREDMVVTVTHGGYVKRVPVSAYRAQRRGGKGRSGMATREDDFVSSLFVANTHTPMLFFSSRGIVYKLRLRMCLVHAIVSGRNRSRGKRTRTIGRVAHKRSAKVGEYEKTLES